MSDEIEIVFNCYSPAQAVITSFLPYAYDHRYVLEKPMLRFSYQRARLDKLNWRGMYPIRSPFGDAVDGRKRITSTNRGDGYHIRATLNTSSLLFTSLTFCLEPEQGAAFSYNTEYFSDLGDPDLYPIAPICYDEDGNRLAWWMCTDQVPIQDFPVLYPPCEGGGGSVRPDDGVLYPRKI